MITIHYDPNEGYAVPDNQVAAYVDASIATAKSFNQDTPEARFVIGSCSIVDEFRVRVVRGEISHTDLQFTFVGKDGELVSISCSETGKLSEWPRGFGDHTIDRLAEIGRARRATSK